MANPVLNSGSVDRFPVIDFDEFHLREVRQPVSYTHLTLPTSDLV